MDTRSFRWLFSYSWMVWNLTKNGLENLEKSGDFIRWLCWPPCIAFMSLLTQLLHVFLGAHLSTTPVTFILVHFFTQLYSSLRSTCPNHLNLALLILFSTHSMLKRLKSSSPCFLSFKDTPHILRTIILSALPQPCQVLRFYSPSLATIYQHSLNTGIIIYMSACRNVEGPPGWDCVVGSGKKILSPG